MYERMRSAEEDYRTRVLDYRREMLIADPPSGTETAWGADEPSQPAIRRRVGRLAHAARALVLAVSSHV
jgi:hypothetical protein